MMKTEIILCAGLLSAAAASDAQAAPALSAPFHDAVTVCTRGADGRSCASGTPQTSIAGSQIITPALRLTGQVPTTAFATLDASGNVKQGIIQGNACSLSTDGGTVTCSSVSVGTVTGSAGDGAVLQSTTATANLAYAATANDISTSTFPAGAFLIGSNNSGVPISRQCDSVAFNCTGTTLSLTGTFAAPTLGSNSGSQTGLVTMAGPIVASNLTEKSGTASSGVTITAAAGSGGIILEGTSSLTNLVYQLPAVTGTVTAPTLLQHQIVFQRGVLAFTLQDSTGVTTDVTWPNGVVQTNIPAGTILVATWSVGKAAWQIAIPPAGLALGSVAGTALDAAAAASIYAPLASPALTGTPTAPTAATADNTTQIATDAFVKAQGYTTGATYAPLASPALTGTPTVPTAATATNTTQAASTAFVKAQYTNVLSGSATLTLGLSTAVGDLQVTYTSQAFSYDQLGPQMTGDFILSFTPYFTTAAWVAGAYGVAGATAGGTGWIINAGYVYQSQVSCTATTGNAPTLTTIGSTQTTADGCHWKVISVQAAGNLKILGLPNSVPATYNQRMDMTIGTNGFTWPSSATMLYYSVPAGASYMTIAGAKSGSTAVSMAIGSLSSSFTYTLAGHGTLRLGAN